VTAPEEEEEDGAVADEDGGGIEVFGDVLVSALGVAGIGMVMSNLTMIGIASPAVKKQ